MEKLERYYHEFNPLEYDIEAFDLLLQCYLSGQMSERQWQEQLKCEEGLKEWYVNTLQKQ